MFRNVDWFKFFATGQFRQMAIANAAVMALAGRGQPQNRAPMLNCNLDSPKKIFLQSPKAKGPTPPLI
ncbi:hypothetical protein BIW19_03510 [Pseudomonas putida]|nr:hypothetical protein BIW19_03510 [Pseudomonas putida]